MEPKAVLRLFPNIRLFLGFGAKTSQAGIQQTCPPCVVEIKNQLAATQAMKSKAESVAFARLSAEFRLFAGSDRNAQGLVIGLRDGTGITLTHCINGSASSASFTPPTGCMGYSNVSIAISLARQQLAGEGIGQPTPHQLQATLVGGKITSPLSGNAIKLHGILQLKVQGMGWGKIASLLGIKLGSVIGEARPLTAVLQPRTNAYSLVTRTVQMQDSMAKATTAAGPSQYVSAKPEKVPEKTAEQLAI
jgi:hypothetical protein